MKMANFLMPKGTSGSHVTNEDQVDPDVTAIGGIAVRRGPIGDIASADAAVVVTNYGDDSVSFLNPATLAVERNVAIEGEPFAAVVSRDRAYISTSSANFDGVSVVDIATSAGIGIDAIEVDPTGKRLYIATTDVLGSQLVVVDAETARVDRTVPVGAPIRDVAFADGTVYVLTSDRVRGGAVSVIDLSTNRITDTVDLGVGAPTQMALSPDRTRAYIVDYDHIAVLCTLSLEVVNNVTVNARPSCVTLDSNGDRLYVADYAGEVTAFSVDSAMPLLFSQLMATDPIALPEPRELQPATT